MKETVKNDVAVASRIQHITDEKDLEIVDFITEYSFKDEKQMYTNGAMLVPLFRVLDAIIQKGKPYQEGG